MMRQNQKSRSVLGKNQNKGLANGNQMLLIIMDHFWFFCTGERLREKGRKLGNFLPMFEKREVGAK